MVKKIKIRWSVGKRKTLKAVPAPGPIVRGKEFAVNVSDITGKIENCQPVFSQKKQRKLTTAQSRNSLKTAQTPCKGGTLRVPSNL